MDNLVYALCGVMSTVCAVLLVRGFIKTRMRLLAWSGSCFVILAVSNIFVYIDKVLIPDIDFLLFRTVLTLVGAVVLVVGLIWETT